MGAQAALGIPTAANVLLPFCGENMALGTPTLCDEICGLHDGFASYRRSQRLYARLRLDRLEDLIGSGCRSSRCLIMTGSATVACPRG